MKQAEMERTKDEDFIKSDSKASAEDDFVVREFIQSPNAIVKSGWRPVFKERWTRKCGNP